MKKPVLFFTLADDNNIKYAKTLERTFKKFHSDIPFHIVQGEELAAYTKDDPMFFYRATPILGEEFLRDYDLVVKLDADQLVLGDLSYIWETKDYDVGTVINWNRVDPQNYGLVQGWGIQPTEYMNCGLVAMRNIKFVHDWKILCFSPQFDRMTYKEQDLLNTMIYFGNWNVRCFDHGDGPAKLHAWWGLIAKGELKKAIVKGDKIIVPAAPDNFPKVDTELKVVHLAGGAGSKKDNWGLYFTEEVMVHINELIK